MVQVTRKDEREANENIIRRFNRNTKIYSTNKQFPIFKELQSIVIKSQQHASAGRLKRTTTDL